MIKISVATPGPADGQSYYRAAGPFTRLRQQMELDVDFPQAFGWVEVKSCDILFVQRPGAEEHLKIIKLARDNSVPVWVDMDDDLLDVPHHNEAWEVFRERRDLVIKCLQLANVVTTAAQPLAQKFRQFNTWVEVIPNALDEKLLKGYDPISKKTDPNTVYWRGSKGHIKDLWEVQDQIVEVAKALPFIKWQFHGYYPWFISERLSALGVHVDHIKALDVTDFMTYLKRGSTHSIGIVPLEDTQWNRQKSNISWLENTLAGAITFAPKFEEFQKPGVITYENSKTFAEELIKILCNRTQNLKESLIQMSLEHIEQSLTLYTINKQRQKIIERLIFLD